MFGRLMRISKKTKKRGKTAKKKIIITLILLPIVILSSFVGVFLVMLQDLKSFAYRTPDTSLFTPEEEIDMPTLRVLANNFEIRLGEYHIPYNLSQTTTINRTSGEIIRYHGTDNGGLHTSENLIATCFHYASLEPGSEKDHALDLIKKMFFAIRMLVEVPNGGLGPDFPGASIGRFYASPEMLLDGNNSWINEEYFRHRNGTGKYSQWRVRLYTSKDEIAGIIGSLAAIQTLVPVPELQKINNLLIAQIVEGHIDTYWQQISGDGKPDGAHLNPPSEPQWKLSLLKMAVNAFPDNGRYQQLYNYQLNKELSILEIGKQSDYDIIDNYYGLYFGAIVVLAMTLVEDNPLIIKSHFRNLDRSYGSLIGHRNAFLNAVYLAAYAKCLRLNPETVPTYNIDNIVWDVKDQLWRFHTYDLFPHDDSYGNRNRTVSRVDKDPEGKNWTIKDPKVDQWKNFLDKTIWGSVLSPFIETFMDGILREHYLMPATVEMIEGSETIWNKNPFKEDGGRGNSGQYINEFAGSSFSLPYWMLTYFGYIPEENEA